MRDKPVCIVLMEFGNEHDTTNGLWYIGATCHGEKQSHHGLPHVSSWGCHGRHWEVGVMEYGHKSLYSVSVDVKFS